LNNESTDQGVALVAGCNGALGVALSNLLVDEGYVVVGCSRRAAQLERAGFQHIATDASTESGVKDVMAAVDAAPGQLKAVVINMAVPSAGVLALVRQVDLARVLQTNVIGPTLLIGQAMRRMMRHRFGRLVGMGSIRARQPVVGAGAYAVSKSALEQLFRQAAVEGAAYGITANVVSISLLESGMSEELSEEQKKTLLNGCLQSEPCSTGDVCNAVEFFLRRESSLVTGQVLRLGFF